MPPLLPPGPASQFICCCDGQGTMSLELPTPTSLSASHLTVSLVLGLQELCSAHRAAQKCQGFTVPGTALN